MNCKPLIGLALLSAMAIYSCTGTTGAPTAEAPSKDSLVKRGAYLVKIMGCNDCHSPKKMTPQGPVPDEALLLSGHPAAMPVAKIDTATAKDWVLFNMNNTAIAGPWGISFAANLTADSTGIGSWTEEQFGRAVRQGMYKGLEGTRHLLPPMPQIPDLADDDLKAIFLYLKSVKPVQNVVPQPVSPPQMAAYYR